MKKKIFKGLLMVLLLGIVLAQIFPPPSINGPVDPQMDISADPAVPSAIAAALKKGCYDCHSNEPRYPAYAGIGAVKYYLNNHIKGGNKHVNFSIWNQYPANEKIHIKEEICEVLEEGRMPLWNYALLHKEAELSKAQEQEICKWVNQL